ncbi:cytochrome P450 71A1-like [Senna tora]|uniref:Cytochrome P450 71A1-like n=1 Tax=Senna tora TaxID=362788 RepID=A0A834T2C0_9FABA|nr:cytochrome P450 71A1-like [Senna tora]
MELVASPSWLSLSTAAACLATFTILLLFGRRRRYNRPPGPRPWPIIGNLNLIGPLPHRSIHALSNKYGPIMQVWFGSNPIVVGSSVEMAEAFLKTHDGTIADRPRFTAGKYTLYNYANITWSQYGPYWRQARKMLLTELLSPKRLESYEYIRKEEVKNMVKRLYESANKTVVLKHHLFALTLNVISRMALGKKFTGRINENAVVSSSHEYIEMVDELLFLNGVLNIGDLIPWLNFMDLQGYIKRMKDLRKKLDKWMEDVLDEHEERRRKKIENYVAEDMVDVLLQLSQDPTLEVKIQRDGVKSLTLELIAGGTDTSSVTLEWAMCELLRKPKMLKNAREELDRVIGRERWVEEQDIPNLPYINAIMKETMRLHPVAPMLIPRLARQDFKIAGYDIPRGTQVLVNIWSIGRNPLVWDNPNEFEPKRFIEKAIDVKGHNFELLPFGAGRRMCPGYSFGLKVIQVSLANLLHGVGEDLLGRMYKSFDSYTWKGILKAKNRLIEGFGFRIGDGRSTKLWTDTWVGEKPLIDVIGNNAEHILDINETVSSIITDNRWQLEGISNICPQNVIREIESIPLPLFSQLSDALTWKSSPNGKYSAKSGYYFLNSSQVCSQLVFPWKDVWRLKCAESIRFFIWIICNTALPTNSLRAQRGMSASSICRRCNYSEETIVHCLRDCPAAKATWLHFGFGSTLNFFNYDLNSWILSFTGLRRNDHRLDDVKFLCIIYGSWKHRNTCVIDGGSPNYIKLHKEIELDIDMAWQVFSDSANISSCDSRCVSWSKPKQGMIKLNTDGSSFGNPGMAGYGGIFRNEDGGWLCGYSGFIGIRTSMFAELTAIKHGLNLAINKGFLKLEVDSDCQEAVNLISSGDISSHHLGVIINDIRTLSKSFEAISFKHILREANFCVDGLAKLGARNRVESYVWEVPPPDISLALLADHAAFGFCRP